MMIFKNELLTLNLPGVFVFVFNYSTVFFWKNCGWFFESEFFNFKVTKSPDSNFVKILKKQRKKKKTCWFVIPKMVKMFVLCYVNFILVEEREVVRW